MFIHLNKQTNMILRRLTTGHHPYAIKVSNMPNNHEPAPGAVGEESKIVLGNKNLVVGTERKNLMKLMFTNE